MGGDARKEEEGRWHRSRPEESGHSLNSHHLSDEGEIEVENGQWHHSGLRHPQRELDYCYQSGADGANLARSAPTAAAGVGAPSRRPAPLMQPPASSAESASISGILQGADSLEHGLLQEAYFMPPLSFGGALMQPMAAASPRPSYDIHLPSNFDFDQDIRDKLLLGQSPLHDDWYPSDSQKARGCDLFFDHVSCFVPFLHQPTFDTASVSPHLILSMLCLGYQYGEDPDCSSDQVGSGVSLSLRCFHRARALIAAAEEEEKANDPARNLSSVQTYLLLQICSMMYLCGSDSSYGLEMHSKMISLARAGGLMQPILVIGSSAAQEDLHSLWHAFVKDESHKRTLFAVHQIDALWYQFLSIPRSISHLEIKHELPCPREYWAASTPSEWAHRQLVARHLHPGQPPVRYADAVRQFLSPEADVDSIPAFDPYGAINIAQFLISSAREVSGWSTMTGKLSMERIEPLRSSLVALRPFIHHPQPGALGATTHTALCEATWEAAMIEMQMWSPSHTSGIVEGSIDGVLSKSVYSAPSCDFLCEPSTVRAIQPHIDWFLRYLDTALPLGGSEAPWIALYAYRAFLLGWNLVRGGIAGAMQAIGIHDGDVDGALAWARKVFRRRQHWQLGKLILLSLDAVERCLGEMSGREPSL